MLELKVGKNSFTNNSGNKVEYTVFYVEINGIPVYLKPNDTTGKLLIENYVNSKGGE